MTQYQPRHKLSRRHLLRSAALLAGLAPITLLTACGGAPSAPPAQPPAAPGAGAKPTTEPGKVSEAVAKSIPPTPTEVPLSTPVPQPAGTTKLLMRVHWSGGFYNDFQAIINNYNQTQGQQDKIYVALERFVANQAGPMATFIADFQAGTQEDIYHINDNYLADLAARNFFSPAPKPVQDYIKQNFLSTAVAAGTWEGEVLGYPTENQPHMIFVNKKLFQEAGLDAEKQPPRTWDDLRRMAKQLTRKDAAGQKIQAGWIAQYNVNDVGQRVISQRAMFQFLAGAPLVDTSVTPPKWDVTSDPARQWTEFLYNVHHVDGSGSQDMGPEDIIWIQRKGAMISHDAYTVVFRVIRRGVPGLLDEQHAIPVMSPDGSRTGNLARNYHFLVSSKGKNKELAWKMLSWLNDGPDYRMQNFQTNTFGFVPSVKNYPMPQPFPDQIKNAFVESMKTPHQTLFPVVQGMPQIIDIMRDLHDALILGKLAPKEYTDQLDAELKKATQNAYSAR